MNGGRKNFTEQFMVQEIIQTRTRHDEFKEILIKFDLRVRGKAAILIIFKKLTIARICPTRVYLKLFRQANFH